MADTNDPQPGASAPHFELPDAEGHTVALAELLGKGPLVLFFVPHPPRGVCKKTACGLRDENAEFEALGARIVGVSPYGKRILRRTAEQQRLPYRFLSDRDRSVHQAYGVETRFLLPARATFVLDQHGTIQWAERHPLAATKHSKGALKAVRRLAAQ